ncbi:cold shock CspA family protein [Pseudomonas sp. EB276 TE3739]|uniref:hypothetical protein n=1 Tax=Pseudomonas TaxID=286 RepID=UPI00209DE131|nr:hypothetical protein [Pseudomonas koreensis]MCP1475148.1 cold shock CspA family protein [Pseudomonas koreensis]
MKGTVSSYDPETGRGTLTPKRSGSSFAVATGFFFASDDYKFRIALTDENRRKLKTGDPVEFDEPKTAGGRARNLRIHREHPLR